MAVEYIVTRSRDNGALSVKGKDNTLSGSHTQAYDVTVRDTANSGFDPRNVSEADVFLNAPLPIVNQSVYYFSGRIVPFFLCRSKVIKRNRNKIDRFHAECSFEFDGEEEKDAQEPPVALSDITPQVDSVVEETTVVIYQDKSTPPKAILTPTGNLYSEPTIQRVPLLTLRISQYESAITHDQKVDRSLLCNSQPYRGRDAYHWMTELVESNKVIIQLAGGPTVAHQVKYTLRRSPFSGGWKEARVLVDSHFFENGKTKAFLDDETRTSKLGYVNLNGTVLNADLPLYDYFKVQPAGDYSGFLQA